MTVAGVFCCLSGSFLSSVGYLVIRKIRTAEAPDVFTFYLSVAVCSAVVVPMLVGNQYPTMNSETRNIEDWIMGTAVGLFAYAGQMLQVYSYARTPATLANTISYLQLLVLIVAAVLIFHEIPDVYSGIGMGLIVISTILLLFVSAKAKPRVNAAVQRQRRARLTAEEQAAYDAKKHFVSEEGYVVTAGPPGLVSYDSSNQSSAIDVRGNTRLLPMGDSETDSSSEIGAGSQADPMLVPESPWLDVMTPHHRLDPMVLAA